MKTVDHLMLVVPDVEAAMRTFQDTLGMTARYGGIHPRGTHNALIHFPGKLGYLELFGPLDHEQVKQNNPAVIDWIAKGGGIWRVAFGTDDVGREHDRMEAASVPVAPIGDWNRKRPDGKTVYWRMFGVTVPTSPRLYPFIIQWPPPEERIPDLEQAGFMDPPALPVTGIERVVYAVEDLDAAVADFERIYGVHAGAETVAPRLGGRSRVIVLDEGAVELVQPTDAGPARDALQKGGPGAFRLCLGTSNIEAARHTLEGKGVRVSDIERRDDGRDAFLIDPQDAHGIALEIVAA